MVDLLVARAAPTIFRATGNVGSSKTVSQGIRDSPRRLVRAHVCRATVTGRRGVGVSQRVVVLVTGGDRGRDSCFAGPRARALAAVPVACGFTGFCCVGYAGETSGQSQEGERFDGRHDDLFFWRSKSDAKV
jgi:hypothetical protein